MIAADSHAFIHKVIAAIRATADAVIGTAARIAVDALRAQAGSH